MRVITTGKRIDHTLNYRTVRFHQEEVGRIPNDIFLTTPETPPLDSLKHSRPVMVQQPEFRGDDVNVREVSKRFQATAPSPIIGGAIGAFVGGVTGAIVGGFASILSGQGAFLIGAGAVGLAGGAYLGASNAANKEVQLVVRDKPILSHQMTGVETKVTKGTLKGKRGYFHSFSADLQSTNHGMYEQPSVQTVKR